MYNPHFSKYKASLLRRNSERPPLTTTRINSIRYISLYKNLGSFASTYDFGLTY